jgi:hypothetical protein
MFLIFHIGALLFITVALAVLLLPKLEGAMASSSRIIEPTEQLDAGQPCTPPIHVRGPDPAVPCPQLSNFTASEGFRDE